MDRWAIPRIRSFSRSTIHFVLHICMEFVVIDATLLSCSRGEMANMQPSPNMPPSFAGASPPSPSQLAVGSGGPMMGQASKDKTMASAEQLVLDLCDPELRENALLELSKVSTHNSFSPSS
jgi:hypothetical protein